MAQKPDIAAAKARKQMIILAVAGVGLAGLAVMQVPKLMKKSDSQPAAAPAATAAATPTGTPTAVVVVPSTTGTTKPAAYVAGVALPGGSKAVVATSQLASFTLFEVKDPFVQQANDETTSPSAAAAASTDAAAPAPSSEPAATGGAGTSTAPPPVIYATIMLDGKPQQLQVNSKKIDREFPKGAPLFVLVSLKKKQAKIGVAGGSFDDSQTVTLTAGKKLTLVDTATGVRYELKLVYTGTVPEQIEGFSTAAQPAATVSEPAAPSGETTAASTP
jgi:hypothetical protein